MGWFCPVYGLAGVTNLFIRVKGILAAVEGPELMPGLEVGPPPHAAVYHVREPLVVRHLQPPVRRPRDRHALVVLPLGRQHLLQVLDRPVPFQLLQLLPERSDGALTPIFYLPALRICFMLYEIHDDDDDDDKMAEIFKQPCPALTFETQR